MITVQQSWQQSWQDYSNYSNYTSRSWIGYLALGIILMVLGVGCIVYSFLATIISVQLFGVALLIKSMVIFSHAVQHRRERKTVFDVFIGMICAGAGVVLIWHPVAGALELTLIFALQLILIGWMKIFIGLMRTFHNWKLLLINGFASFVLGIAVLVLWPFDSFWLIGTFVGTDIFLHGLGLLVGGITFPLITGSTGYAGNDNKVVEEAFQISKMYNVSIVKGSMVPCTLP